MAIRGPTPRPKSQPTFGRSSAVAISSRYACGGGTGRRRADRARSRDGRTYALRSLSAATYASAAVDHACFAGVQCTDIDGPLDGFAVHRADALGIASRLRSDAAPRSAARHLLRVCDDADDGLWRYRADDGRWRTRRERADNRGRLGEAAAVIALTNSHIMNFEIALVARVQDDVFERESRRSQRPQRPPARRR